MRKYKSIPSAALFASFMFIQLIILRMANQAGRGYLTDSAQEWVYCFIQVAVILGFLAHALVHKALGDKRVYRVIYTVDLVICSVGAAVMLFSSESSAWYLAVTAVTVFALGGIGGAVYLRLAKSASGLRLGLCIGSGYAAAIALQYVLQLMWGAAVPIALALIIAFVLLYALTLRQTADEDTQDTKPAGVPALTLVCAVIITAALLMFTSYYNSYIHHLQVASGYTDYNVYSLPRLLMIPGILLFGFLGDFKKGRYLPVAALCMAVIALLNAVLIGSETYILNMCLYYLAITAAIAYYHLTFLRIAPHTKSPSLWAVMGRMIDSAVVILQFAAGFSQMSAIAVLVMDIVVLAAVIVAMAVSGGFNLSPASDSEHALEETGSTQAMPESVPPPADPLDIIGESCSLTPTERRVLRELVRTDDKQDVIAASLNMSVNTLRHHITSIYKKTGVQTRAALCKLTVTGDR